MAIVTLCPQCQTAFSVQPEHLSAADGWVQCGKCEHLFQVDQHLFEMDDPQPMPELIQPLSKPQQADFKFEQGQYQDTAKVQLFLAVLAFALLFQWTVHQRHVIAAHVPELHPVLLGICKPLNCELSVPIDIEQVSMESSTFKRVADNTFVFEGTVKNLSNGALMPPALELSLQSEGETRVRKVISADQLGFHEPLRPFGNHPFSVSFTLEPSLSQTIDGFKALLFYP
jgi:predicted Zn finger-like uncharacterized protein